MSRYIDTALGLVAWVLLLYGLVVREPWFFAVGAFFVLLDTIKETR